MHPFIIEDTFIHCLNVLAPESFTVCVEFVAICMDFNVTWEFDGNQIINDSNHVIINSDLSTSRYKTCVEVIQSSERDGGTYTVTVTAASGSDSADIIVKISKFLCQKQSLVICFLSGYYPYNMLMDFGKPTKLSH